MLASAVKLRPWPPYFQSTYIIYLSVLRPLSVRFWKVVRRDQRIRRSPRRTYLELSSDSVRSRSVFVWCMAENRSQHFPPLRPCDRGSLRECRTEGSALRRCGEANARAFLCPLSVRIHETRCERPISYRDREFLILNSFKKQQRRELFWGAVGIELSIGENVV